LSSFTNYQSSLKLLPQYPKLDEASLFTFICTTALFFGGRPRFGFTGPLPAECGRFSGAALCCGDAFVEEELFAAI
jgi:hypothetical protein